MRFLRFIALPFILALFSFTVHATLTTPSIVSPSIGATNQTPDVMIDWSSVTGATIYQYKISTNPALTGAIIVSAGTNSYMYLSNLRFGTTYYWQCRAVKNTAPLDSSAWSTIWYFTTTDQLTQVSPSNGSTNQTPDVMLDWSSLSGITYYDYEYDTVSTFNSPLHVYGSATSSYSYFYTANLRFGTKYYWRARARHSVDTTQWTPIWYFTTTDQITQVSPSNGATNQTPDVMLDWSSLSGITYYDY
ncbi:MAG: hypothetical protein WCM76_10765, partial [Bacteroidota bacterium]